jgi:hypothetical protein
MVCCSTADDPVTYAKREDYLAPQPALEPTFGRFPSGRGEALASSFSKWFGLLSRFHTQN